MLLDHLGSTVLSTIISGVADVAQGYYAYGKTRWGNLQTDHRFTGQKYDNTGLYYYNARYYDPAIGTFISPDTLVPDPTNVWDYNRYGYGRLNPLKYNDPNGHAAECQPDCSPHPILEQCQGSITCVWTEAGQWLLQNPDYDPLADPNFGHHADYSLILAMLVQINLDNGNQAQATQYFTMQHEGLAPQVVGDTIGTVSYVAVSGIGVAIRYVKPSSLRWTQRTAGGRGRAAELRQSLAEKGWVGEPIDVVETADGLVTVDHTRAAVALELDMASIPVRVHSPNEPLPQDMIGRFRSPDGKMATTWGEAIAYRAASQRPPLPATGTSNPPRMPPR